MLIEKYQQLIQNQPLTKVSYLKDQSFIKFATLTGQPIPPISM